MSSSEEPSATSSWIGTPAANATIADFLAARPVHEQSLFVHGRRLDPLALQGLLQLRSFRGADANRSADAGGQLLERGLDDELAAVDDQHLIDGLRNLGQHMAGDQHCPLAGREGAQEVAQPAHALRVEPVRRLVEDQQLGIAEQCGREPQPLPHPERVALDATVRRPVELDQAQHLIHARVRQADSSAQHPQVIAAGAARDGSRSPRAPHRPARPAHRSRHRSGRRSGRCRRSAWRVQAASAASSSCRHRSGRGSR